MPLGMTPEWARWRTARATCYIAPMSTVPQPAKRTSGPSFKLYVDESGDPGLGRPGASAWFVLGGLVTRIPDSKIVLKLADDLLAQFGKSPRFEFHFEKMDHDQRVAITQKLGGERRFRMVAVAIHKPSLVDPDKFGDGDRLYNYALRLVLERVSWLCSAASSPPEGDRTLDLWLSYRGGLDHRAIHSYLRRLEQSPDSSGIDFTVVRPDQIHVELARNWRGLQFADAVASGTRRALEPHRLGVIEDRYLRELGPALYKHKKHHRVFGYGLKVFPAECIATLPEALRSW